MSIYITQKQKEEWEKNLVDSRMNAEKNKDSMLTYTSYVTMCVFYEELLSKAIVLPEFDGWGNFALEIFKTERLASNEYPNGIIIKPKTP